MEAELFENNIDLSEDICWGLIEDHLFENDKIIYSKMINLGYKQIRNLEILLSENILRERYTFTGYFFIAKAVIYKEIRDLALFCIIDKKEILEMLFNYNSIHLIFNGDLSIYPESIKKIDRFIELLKEYEEDTHEYFLDSTASMGLYGIRPIGDLDFLTKRKWPNEIEIEDEIENNNKYIKYHSVGLDELLTNETFYLLYKGLKVVSLEELKKWKLKKGTYKDKEDVFLIKNFQESSLMGQIIRKYILIKRNLKILIFRFYRYIICDIIKSKLLPVIHKMK